MAAGTTKQEARMVSGSENNGDIMGYITLIARDNQSEKERSGWEDSLVGAAAAMAMKREMMAVVDIIFASSLRSWEVVGLVGVFCSEVDAWR